MLATAAQGRLSEEGGDLVLGENSRGLLSERQKVGREADLLNVMLDRPPILVPEGASEEVRRVDHVNVGRNGGGGSWTRPLVGRELDLNRRMAVIGTGEDEEVGGRRGGRGGRETGGGVGLRETDGEVVRLGAARAEEDAAVGKGRRKERKERSKKGVNLIG